MVDKVDAATRSRIMSRVRGKDTSPEIIARRAFHAAGFRFRLHRKDLPGKPDIVFPKYKTAVFIHGCFWHGHECSSFRMPASNVAYWKEKIERNKQRGEIAIDALTRSGWNVCIIWECDLSSGIERLIEDLKKKELV